MSRRLPLVVERAVAGILILVAVAYQLVVAVQQPNFHPANFFGYFTILSNLFASIVLLIAAGRTGAPSHRLDVVRGAATLYMAMVGAIFSLLLAGLESDVIGWVNLIVHYVAPLVLVADWMLDPPHERIAVSDMLLWLTFPAAYVIYTLVRGAIVHWYPYPFFNVDQAGWPAVAAAIAGMFVLTIVFAWLVRTAGTMLGERAKRAPLAAGDEVGDVRGHIGGG